MSTPKLVISPLKKIICEKKDIKVTPTVAPTIPIAKTAKIAFLKSSFNFCSSLSSFDENLGIRTSMIGAIKIPAANSNSLCEKLKSAKYP